MLYERLGRYRWATGELSAALDASTLDDASQQELRDMGLDGLADANQREADFFTADRVVNTLASFEAIAQHLTGLPGRKNLIWLSGGIPLTIGFDEMPAAGGTFSTRDRRIFSVEMDAAVRALNNSGVAIYPVDARGLMPPPGFSAASRAPLRTPPTLARQNANVDAMCELADRTGGRASYNTNDLARAIRRAVDDGRVGSVGQPVERVGEGEGESWHADQAHAAGASGSSCRNSASAAAISCSSSATRGAQVFS
jgi:VWFA-related protein